MKRRELMTAIAVAAGLSVSVTMSAPSYAANPHSQATDHASPQGYLKSGNPKAAGGPDNPGRHNPFNAY